MDDEFDLDEEQMQPEPVEPAEPVVTGMDRRHFVKLAVAAAATTGLTLKATAQQRTGGGPQQPATPPIPLGQGDPPAEAFQPYPGGTGALLEKLAKERGRAAFDRQKFEIEPWKGAIPTTAEEIAYLPVTRLSALVKARKISSVQLTEIYLERMKRLDPKLLCAVTIMEAQAREAAQQADAEIKAGKYRGPLHGIPWGVKDLFATKGVRTTWGSANFENQVLDYDAEVVVRMRDAGAVLIAKLATGEFASGDRWFRGMTRNPWNPEEGSSGSSAGPGSATAAGCVAFALGTETQGSIVSPTTRNGLSALRPTFGRVSRYGGMVLAWSMDKVGPMCRTIEDCALIFNTIHGADEKDPATVTAPFQFDRKIDISKLRIGYDDRAPKEFLDKLTALGANLKPMPARPGTNGLSSLGVESAAAFDYWVSSLPPLPPDSAAAIAAAAADTTAGRGRGGGGGGGRGSRGRFSGGRTTTALAYMQSQRRRLIVMQQMAAIMKDFDMYVSGSGDVGLTNQTGHPAAVFPYAFGPRPAGQGAAGTGPPQPLCTTIIGDLFADDKILSVAYAYQQATEWHKKHPALG